MTPAGGVAPARKMQDLSNEAAREFPGTEVEAQTSPGCFDSAGRFASKSAGCAQDESWSFCWTQQVRGGAQTIIFAPADQMHRSFVVLTAQARLALPQDDMAIFFFEIRSFGARKILRG
ncbi:MAG TPA: hypothetical protein VFK81_09685 [Terriglobales bacterium]|nr:hypothetical protein [Terriglobales bacterium]